jgi:hypothetical protein
MEERNIGGIATKELKELIFGVDVWYGEQQTDFQRCTKPPS